MAPVTADLVTRQGGTSALPLIPAPALDPPARDEQPHIPGITAEAYLVVDADTGRTLVERDARARRAIASLAKVMTALVTLERAKLDDAVEVDDAVLNVGRGSTLMGVEPGERLSVRDLLYGLMLPSGNDAAIALAQHVGGSQAGFVALMNRRAVELGLWDTRFANPHGLDSRAGDHYSTAYDLIQLTKVALGNPTFREIVATRTWKAKGAKREYEMFNGNLLLINYEGADGVKIGYTGRAGQTLIGSVVQDGKRVLVVVLGSKQRVIDAMRLLDTTLPQVLTNPRFSELYSPR